MSDGNLFGVGSGLSPDTRTELMLPALVMLAGFEPVLGTPVVNIEPTSVAKSYFNTGRVYAVLSSYWI